MLKGQGGRPRGEGQGPLTGRKGQARPEARGSLSPHRVEGGEVEVDARESIGLAACERLGTGVPLFQWWHWMGHMSSYASSMQEGRC